ncbi:MAG: hypothetical protein GXP49_09385 [Deltaproteobacteria bacterium]|nr:hypothetical protein [Deltaproteobacteria bacterium]
MKRFILVVSLLALVPIHAAADSGEAIFARLPELKLPELSPDIIAMGDQLTFFLADINLASNTNDNQSSSELAGAARNGGDDVYFNAGLKALFDSYREYSSYAYRLTGIAGFKTTVQDSNYDLQPSILLSPRFKYYFVQEPAFFLHGLLDLNYRTYKMKGIDAINTLGLRAGVGSGYGRVFDIGPRQRLIAMEKALLKARAIEDEIPSETGDKILLQLYMLRNELGYYKQLAYTLKQLAADGLLAEEVDFELAYKLLQILRDPSFNSRREGLQFWIDFAMYDEFLEEKVLSLGLVGYLEYAAPISEESQVEVNADLGTGFYNAEHWRLGLDVLSENYMHNSVSDPIGTFYYGGLLDLESVNGDAGKVGYLAAGLIGYANRFTRNLELGIDFLVGVGSACMALNPGDGVGSGPFGLPERWFERTMPTGSVDTRTLDPAQPGYYTQNSSDPGLVLLLRAGFNFGLGRGNFVIY